MHVCMQDWMEMDYEKNDYYHSKLVIIFYMFYIYTCYGYLI